MTDVESFSVLEPRSDAFRNFLVRELDRPAPEQLVDRAQQLTLSAPAMTALVGGVRVLGANAGFGPLAKLSVFAERPQTLTSDFFVHLLNMDTQCRESAICEHFYEGGIERR